MPTRDVIDNHKAWPGVSENFSSETLTCRRRLDFDQRSKEIVGIRAAYICFGLLPTAIAYRSRVVRHQIPESILV